MVLEMYGMHAEVVKAIGRIYYARHGVRPPRWLRD